MIARPVADVLHDDLREPSDARFAFEDDPLKDPGRAGDPAKLGALESDLFNEPAPHEPQPTDGLRGAIAEPVAVVLAVGEGCVARHDVRAENIRARRHELRYEDVKPPARDEAVVADD